MTWLYLLKQRSEVPTIHKSFYQEIKTQYFVDLRILRTDNALEFTQQSISSFCESHGIIHQTSCSHTSQQNEVAERKHRHVLDVTRTLMSHMHVPKYLWSDVVLTACFLINRMSSCVLHGDISFSCLHPNKPLYHIPPRSFGCTFFFMILLLGWISCPLALLSVFFLGYSRTVKGY